MLKLGTNNIDKIYLGSTKIERAYLGDTLVYGSAPPVHDYGQDYFTLEALESGTFTFTIDRYINTDYITSVSYSIDNGSTWVTTNNTSSVVTITTPTIAVGNKVLWKGIGKSYCDKSHTQQNGYICSFTSTGTCDISGNMMSLLYGDNFQNQVVFPSNSQEANFFRLFYSLKVVDAKNLILPATTLTKYCYHQLFYNCSNLIYPPKVLPAQTSAQACYTHMFLNCTSLLESPDIQLLHFSSNYSISLNGMFSGCSSIGKIKIMILDALNDNNSNFWVQGVSSTGTFIKNASATWTNVFADYAIPSGWTVQTASS